MSEDKIYCMLVDISGDIGELRKGFETIDKRLSALEQKPEKKRATVYAAAIGAVFGTASTLVVTIITKLI